MAWKVKNSDVQEEKYIADAVQHFYGFVESEKAPEAEPTYDYKYWTVHGGIRYCEIKADWKSRKTHNAYFETRNVYRGKASGLTITRADIWAHYLPGIDQILLVDPKALLWYLTVHQSCSPSLKIQYKELAGDNNSAGFCVPIPMLLDRDWIRCFSFDLEWRDG